MKQFENMGFTSTVTTDKLKIEIPISNLVFAFESAPNNCVGEDGSPSRIKRGKRQQFAEWVAEHIIDEHDQETGASFIAEAFDNLFEQIFEGYEICDDFVAEPVLGDCD